MQNACHMSAPVFGMTVYNELTCHFVNKSCGQDLILIKKVLMSRLKNVVVHVRVVLWFLSVSEFEFFGCLSRSFSTVNLITARLLKQCCF